MRIVVVSSHYPPNFVSGGTLQAQRIARGLRGRGHDVSVYAGWLGDERRPLDTWSETDDTGLPVRWVVTTPWTAWDDDRNWDNPEVTADFSSYLDEVRPDVVHLHSLQSMGAGLVVAAAGTGCRVVVTMHDFWWCCARQFLVDRDLRPCSLVVDAGNCECQRDRAWLEARTHALRAIIDQADLVLAPSASAARVLEANGIDPARLAVDENGLPDVPPAGPERPFRAGDTGPERPFRAGDTGPERPFRAGDTGPERPPGAGETRPSARPLRFLYLGGPNELKGVHVLLAAADLLGERDGWRLIAHDIEGYLRRSGTSVDGLPVEVAPAFDPAAADEVYGAADVVVVPSVMRETFSLVVREALTRGLPVICTDTLGPEEVVEHEGNGLVVPAADPAALAKAIRRLVDEPGLLASLQGWTRPVSVRALDDQVDGLESTFSRLLAAKPELVRESGPIRRVLFVCGIEGAPLRYRARLPAEALGLLGVHADVVHYRDPEVPQLAARADAVVFYRVPATDQVLSLIADVRATTATYFDVDDLIFDPDVAAEIPALSLLPAEEASLWLEGVRRYRTTMEACDAYIGSTEPLCRHAAQITGLPAHRFDNGVGVVLGRLSDQANARPRRPGPPRLGYLSGTITHDHDWFSIEPAVADALNRHPDVELWLVGHVPDSAVLRRFESRVRRQPLIPWTELPAVLRDIDVNLAPLVTESRFNQAKSAIKWLEAALVRTPTVASATEPFREVIEHGANGFLADGHDQWSAALDLLLSDDEVRARTGRRAERDALLAFSPHLQARRYLAILEQGRRQAGTRKVGWLGVSGDEPPLRVALEPYSPPSTVDGRARNRRLVGAAWSSWRIDGPAKTGSRILGFVRSRASMFTA